MFHLLQSIWMFTAAGIIVPVVIHFWNRKQGKTLKVGSISLLTQSYTQQAKSLKLQERLLLLLRCLLILLVALLLSHPVWDEDTSSRKQQGWILMEKQGLPQTYNRFKPVIDSLLKQQYEFHYFDAGFAKDNMETVLSNSKDTLFQNNFSYWSLLSSLDQQVPSTVPVFLFTTNSLRRFAGSRPQVAMNLHWFTYTYKDSVSEWLAKAYLTSADSIRLVAASSQPSGTAYFYKNASVTSQKIDGYTIRTGNGMLASYQQEQPIEIDTATLSVSIFTDEYPNDAAYVKAAFQAIQQYSKRKIKLSFVNNIADIPNQQDWIFWLSDQPVSNVDGSTVFMYEKGKVEPVASSIQINNNGNDAEPVALQKRIIYPTASSGLSKTIWQDGFGDPLLVLEKSEAPVYHFFSHFDPSWNDLPWSNVFPRMIFELVWSEENNNVHSDNRVMDQRQLQPIFSTEGKAIVKEQFIITHDLSAFFWLAAFALFFLDRYISFRTKTAKANA